MIEDVVAAANEKMDKTVVNLNHEFTTIRTGRASAAMLERIQVDYYGTPTPITQLAGIKSPEAHLLVVEPWDKHIVSAVAKAILGIRPGDYPLKRRVHHPPALPAAHRGAPP